MTYIFGGNPVAAAQQASATAVVQNSRLRSVIAEKYGLPLFHPELEGVLIRLFGSQYWVSCRPQHLEEFHLFDDGRVDHHIYNQLLKMSCDNKLTLYPLVFDPTPLIAHVHELIIQTQRLQSRNTRPSQQRCSINHPTSPVQEGIADR